MGGASYYRAAGQTDFKKIFRHAEHPGRDPARHQNLLVKLMANSFKPNGVTAAAVGTGGNSSLSGFTRWTVARNAA
jgi:hypothetical protein